MAKRNIPKMAKPENLNKKVEEKITSEEVVEVVETEETKEEVVETEETVKETPKERTVKVIGERQLRLRIASSTSADVLTLLDPGTECKVLDDCGEWTKVNVNGKTGYVMTKFVK